MNAKSIDGEDENSVEQFNLNFSITPISQGSDLTIVRSESQIKEANPLVPVDITITPEDTDGSEKVSSVTLYISEQSEVSNLSAAPVFILGDTEINFTSYSDDSFSGYKLELESDYYSKSIVNRNRGS